MSVVVGKRGETKLKVIDEAEKLALYTVAMVTNERHFPKRYRWVYASKIADCALNLNSLTHMANAVYPTNRLEGQIRLKYITEARRMPLAEIGESLSSSIASLEWGDAHKEIRELKRFYKEELNHEIQ